MTDTSDCSAIINAQDVSKTFADGGYMPESIAKRCFRELRADRMWTGIREFQRLIIARALSKRALDRL